MSNSKQKIEGRRHHRNVRPLQNATVAPDAALDQAEFPVHKRVIVAEDDVDMRVLLAATLRSDGFEVIQASNGAELLKLLRETNYEESGGRPDLLVSDIWMPDLTGLDVLADLKDSGSPIPVILITAFGSTATHEQARRLGALLVLDKPFELEELEQVVKAVLRSQYSFVRPRKAES